MSEYVYVQEGDYNEKIKEFINKSRSLLNDRKIQSYFITSPLGESRYSYDYDETIVFLVPGYKINFINFNKNRSVDFENYFDEFIEDIGSISDKFRYKDEIGRPRVWKSLCSTIDDNYSDVLNILSLSKIDDPKLKRISELLISLVTGSVNDIRRVGVEAPDTILDKIKKKIILFDRDQTRFIYQNPDKKEIRIQGLSGTGKTELLLHKLKELYIASPDTKIAFTCHNEILADSLRKRIPEFFDFMKVEQQIQWNSRLWCTRAWGSRSDINSGIYSYITNFYGLSFNRFNKYGMNFESACQIAVKELKEKGVNEFAFNYCLIDESQDFSESFFDLCSLVTSSNVYVGGDVFQSIFDENISFSIKPDFLLTKCYRTEPRNLMFSHGLGMGLFENRKLRWLEKQEWESCGYLVDESLDTIRLTREPIRRFEDSENSGVVPTEITSIKGDFYPGAAIEVLRNIDEIVKNNPTLQPSDIGIIFLDSTNSAFSFADEISTLIGLNFNWKVNKGHESKEFKHGEVFLSNKNNVKGLEFAFVICVARKIKDSYSYRNALYMTLTRSFLKTSLITSCEENAESLSGIEDALAVIVKTGAMEFSIPTEEEKLSIKSEIDYSGEIKTFDEVVAGIFEELDIEREYRGTLFNAAASFFQGDYEYESLYEFIEKAYGIKKK